MRLAAALAHEAIDHGKAKARAAMVPTGGEIGLKGLVHRLRRHADAFVGDRYHQCILLAGRLDRDQTAIRHGCRRIEAEVEDGLLEKCRVERDCGKTVIEIERDPAFGADRDLENIGHAAQQVGDID